MSSFEQCLKSGHCSTDQALTLFDQLPPVTAEEMQGRWRGAGFHTGHPMDGLLETFHWYGKHFVSADVVHPLVCQDRHGELFNVDPRRIPMALAMRAELPRHAVLGRAFQWLKPLLATDKPRARLRMLDYRGQVSATMVYDHLPIHDVFRKVNNNTLLGLMDLRGLEAPFFFVLYRD